MAPGRGDGVARAPAHAGAAGGGEATTRDLAQMEVRFAENPADADLLASLSSQYYARGIFNDRARDIYQKALQAAPRDAQIIRALNIATFLRQLRRFTIESGQHEQLDQDGLQESILLVRGYLKELSSSPDLFFGLGDLYLVKGDVLLAIGAYENAIKCGFRDQCHPRQLRVRVPAPHLPAVRARLFCQPVPDGRHARQGDGDLPRCGARRL